MDTQSTLGLSASAAKRIAHLAAKEKQPGAMLRVSVAGGGCSGFQYQFGFDTQRNEDDAVIEKDGARVLVDATSMQFLGGALLDFVETLGAAHFEIKNPNAAASCGCGNSFAV